MTADDIIGLLAVINTLVMGMVGWLLRQLSTMRSDIARITTDMTITRSELRPPGSKPLAERVTNVETGIAIIQATTRRGGTQR